MSNRESLKSGSQLAAKDDLKILPMADLQQRLSASPDGLGEAEAQKRLTHQRSASGNGAILNSYACTH